MNIPESLTRAEKISNGGRRRKMAKSIERINFSLETAMKIVPRAKQGRERGRGKNSSLKILFSNNFVIFKFNVGEGGENA